MTPHTPGPWKAKHRHGLAKEEDDEMDGLGWEIDGPPEAWGRGQFERAADAHLIAAAPDLLAACQEFVKAWEKSRQLEKTDIALQMAKTAIAKATHSRP